MMTQSILPGEEWMRPDGNERSKTADYVPYEVMRSMIPYKWKTWFNVLTGRTETLFNKEGNLTSEPKNKTKSKVSCSTSLLSVC